MVGWDALSLTGKSFTLACRVFILEAHAADDDTKRIQLASGGVVVLAYLLQINELADRFGFVRSLSGVRHHRLASVIARNANRFDLGLIGVVAL